MDIRKVINQIIYEGSKNYNNNSPPPAATYLVTFLHVNPKGSTSPPPGIPTITQDYPRQHSNHPDVLPLAPGDPSMWGNCNLPERTSLTLTWSISLSATPVLNSHPAFRPDSDAFGPTMAAPMIHAERIEEMATE